MTSFFYRCEIQADSVSEPTFSWYIDDEELENLENSTPDEGDNGTLSRTIELALTSSWSNATLKCVVNFDGETKEDSKTLNYVYNDTFIGVPVSPVVYDFVKQDAFPAIVSVPIAVVLFVIGIVVCYKKQWLCFQAAPGSDVEKGEKVFQILRLLNNFSTNFSISRIPKRWN